MIRLKPGDVVAFKHKNTYYYAVILSKNILFGGGIIFAFYLTSKQLLSLEEFIQEEREGFNVIVDFIYAKREHRITKIGTISGFEKFLKYKYFKHTHPFQGKAPVWFIYDENRKLIKRVSYLSEEQKKYPPLVRFTDYHLKDFIDQKWSPEKDPRI